VARILLIGLCALGASLPLAPAAAAAGRETTVVSKLYGYSAVLPASTDDLVATYATRPWPGGYVAPGLQWFDTYTDLGRPRMFIVGARPVGSDSTLASWTAYFAAHRQPFSACSPPQSDGHSTLGGASALVLVYWCDNRSVYAYAITALHGGRGYFMIVVTDRTIAQAADRLAFETARRSFRWE
jgi:hypothetical protein